jgi:short-subunit dehydrogenase involved in D-alanine esterification of teichoic acids
MKVFITGHTSGIGKSLFDTYKNHNHDVFGFSRSTGYDINNEATRKLIIEQSKDADIFINNAYSNPGQTQMLTELAGAWEGKSKKIINISSKLSFLPKGKITQLDDYIDQKTEQNNFVVSQITKANPKITNIIIGLVDTPMSQSFLSVKINPETLSKFIYQMSIIDELYIQQIILDVPDLNWKDIRSNKY